jgi:hypothetical protein
MMSPSPRHNPSATRGAYPPEVFNLLTDILADLVLEDLKQYPRIPTSRPIDSFPRQENTALPRQEGRE